MEDRRQLEEQSAPVERISFDRYIDWARSKLGLDLSAPAIRQQFLVNQTAALTSTEESTFFRAVAQRLKDCSLAYAKSGGYRLFMTEDIDNAVSLVRKSFESTLDKSYRLNILWNRRFPREPVGGWYCPNNWFQRLDDLIRTSVVCKYLDGLECVASGLMSLATELGFQADSVPRATDNGYYAIHFYVEVPITIAGDGYQPLDIRLKCEIQITTQLQEILRQLTHTFYEHERIKNASDRQSWKWAFASPRFKATYLGHTLHLIEGLILEIKNDSVVSSVSSDPASGFSHD
jgi:hypothetical protein